MQDVSGWQEIWEEKEERRENDGFWSVVLFVQRFFAERQANHMKTTSELLQKIRNMKKNDIGLLSGKDFSSPKIHIYLSGLLHGQGISNMDFFNNMDLERSYGYQILNDFVRISGINGPLSVNAAGIKCAEMHTNIKGLYDIIF